MTEVRNGALVQTVIKDRMIYRALARAARKAQMPVATLLRQIIVEYLRDRDLVKKVSA